MELGIISSRKKIEGETQIVTDLFRNGLLTFHLRKNHYSRKKYKQFILSIPKEFHNRIVIHNYPWLVFKYELKGVHFSARQMQRSKRTFFKLFLRLVKPQASISRGYDNLSDLLSERKKYNFVILNPVFDSVSDETLATAFSAKTIESSVKTSKLKVIGLGGVQTANLEFLKEMGFEGGIINSIIWSSEGDKIKSFKRAVAESIRVNTPEVLLRRVAI